MNSDFEDVLADNGEVVLDKLLENEILAEIPVLGTSLKLLRGIKSIRDRVYLSKIRKFIECLGEFSAEQRRKIIDETKKDKHSRAKFGDALFTAIEQSDSFVKIEYIAIATEAFSHGDIDRIDLRLICHVIKNSFTDELTSIVEGEHLKIDLKYSVASGLAETEYQPLTYDGNSEPHYHLSPAAKQLQLAWKKYKKP